MYERGSPLERTYGWAAPTLGVLTSGMRELQRMVLTGGPHTVQVFAAVLADPEREARALKAPAISCVRLARLPRERLLRHAYGTVPEGFHAALIKLGPTVVPRECYGLLHKAFDDPALARVITLRRTLPAPFLRLLASPVAALLNPKLLTRLPLTEPTAVEALIEALTLRSRTPPWSEDLAALKRCTIPRTLFHWLHNRFEQPFPPPPWAGDDLLEPVTSAEALRALGEGMHNCLAECVQDVGQGARYYFVTRTTPRIAVGLELRVARWHVTQVLADRNRRPKPELRTAVLDRLVQAGFVIDLDHETYELVARALGMDEQLIHLANP